MLNTTLCYIEKDGKYLMLNRNKKKNDLNEGKWIGIGGKFQDGETPDECLIREVREETGIVLSHFHFHGIIHFISDVETEDMYLYTAVLPGATKAHECAEGTLESTASTSESINEVPECAEGTLEWIAKEEVLNLPIWEGDRLFLEKLIRGDDRIEMTLEYIGSKLVRSCVFL